MNNVFDTVSHGKKKAGLKEFCAALDKAVVLCDPTAEVFVKLDPLIDSSGLFVLHSAVVKGSWAEARDIRMNHAGWTHLGEVAKPAKWIVERLTCEFPTPWPNLTDAFVVEEWRAWVRSGPINFEVSAPAPLWSFVESRSHDITDQAEWDWEALAADDGCVAFAHLQVLPIQASEDVSPDDQTIAS